MEKISLKYRYNDVNKLKGLIEQCYFNEIEPVGKNNGKLIVADKIDIPRDGSLYSILDGLDSFVKLKNDSIINGTMTFDVSQIGDTIELIPNSKYCIKQGDKYTFY